MQENRPLVSLILPAYNEAAILKDNVERVLDYLKSLHQYSWEVIIIDDGSADETGTIADELARAHPIVRALHHPRNFGVGQAMKYGFSASRGRYVVTMDIDLSYTPDHIGAMLERLIATRAKLVLASPYMRGGKIANVPLLRRVLSVGANWFLSIVAHGNLSTLTCMVRAYDGPFIRSIHHRQTGMDIMPESVYKTMILRGKIEQMPAVLDWGVQSQGKPKRRSSMRIARHILATLLSGFLFRPFMFFILPGLVLLAFSSWVNLWMVIHFLQAVADAAPGSADQVISTAVASAYREYPHTFIVGLLSLMLSIQLISLGILALQSKSYFEEIFHLGTETARSAAESYRGQAGETASPPAEDGVVGPVGEAPVSPVDDRLTSARRGSAGS